MVTFGQSDIMNELTNIEWCAVGFGPCWTREEWIALWASFGGVFVAFLLGAASQTVSENRKSNAALRFFRDALLKSMDAMSFFDGEYRKFGTEDQIARGFGSLAHAAAVITWASKYPEKFELELFLRILMVERRISGAGQVAPSIFAGSNFICDASGHLSNIVPQIAADIRFLLELPEITP